jgi:hypothetical protein
MKISKTFASGFTFTALIVSTALLAQQSPTNASFTKPTRWRAAFRTSQAKG